MLPERVVVPAPNLVTTPVPLMTLLIVIADAEFKLRVASFVTLPLPKALLIPICNVPALIVVPPV